MNKIKNVLICGLGGVGCIYAKSIKDNTSANLKILVDENRYEKYSTLPRVINGIEYSFDFIKPECLDFIADLIIIATKSNGLESAIKQIHNFVSKDTIIMSFINGITSETELSKIYGFEHIVHSYIICHTIFRNNNNITHDGITKIIFNSVNKNKTHLALLENFFKEANLSYEIPKDIIKSMWVKFALNCSANQVSGLYGKTFGEMLSCKETVNIISNIIEEIETIAKLEANINVSTFKEEVFQQFNLMIPEGKTSMLQDIESGRLPELDLFGETILNIARKHKLNVPTNQKIYDELCKKILKTSI